MVSIQEEIANIALRKAEASTFFSVCVIREVAELKGASTFQIHRMEEYDSLRKAHCIDYKDMSPEMRAEITRLSNVVLDSFPRKTMLQRFASLFK